MDEPIEVVQGNEFSRQLTWSDEEPKVDVKGPSQERPRVANRGGRLTISGRFSRPGKYEITITQKRTAKITVNVSQAKPWLETGVLNALAGKREPLDPPANLNRVGWRPAVAAGVSNHWQIDCCPAASASAAVANVRHPSRPASDRDAPPPGVVRLTGTGL